MRPLSVFVLGIFESKHKKRKVISGTRVLEREERTSFNELESVCSKYIL